MAYCLNNLIETLMHTLQLHPDHQQNCCVVDRDMIPKVQFLLKTASFTRDLFENLVPGSSGIMEVLEDRIRDAAQEAGESFQNFTISPAGLQKVIAVFEAVNQELITVTGAGQRPDHHKRRRLEVRETPGVSSGLQEDRNLKNMVVGVTEDLKQLRDRLTSYSRQLQIIPIVGMGGTGKTTLARILYNEYLYDKSHFDKFAWATVSQDCDPKNVLISLLDCDAESADVQEVGKLKDNLYKRLFGTRYLIVLDDLWSYDVWNDLRMVFPDNNQRSRIIVTTRQNDVADYFKSESHEMHLLNKDDSWNLLKTKVFGEESCPHELKDTGKRIAKNCRGLPLAVNVISGLLSLVERSTDSWEQVAACVSESIANIDEQCQGILSLSYAYMPYYLQPCFLYMGANYPEDYQIPAFELTCMWIAEGFLNPIGDKSLEEVAESNLKALLDRNVIFVYKREPGRKVRSYGIHDLLRELCLRKAQEKKFLYVKHPQIHNLPEDALCVQRVCISGMDEKSCEFAVSIARSFQCIGSAPSHIFSSLCLEPYLLRSLYMPEVSFSDFPEEILKLVNLRLLALTCTAVVPDTISVLRRLKVLLLKQAEIRSVSTIFNLPQLRQFLIYGVKEVDRLQPERSHENLQMLRSIPLRILTQIQGRFPNLRRLEIFDKYSTDIIIDLTCFSKLETLNCYKFSLSTNLKFPNSLKDLTLYKCRIPDQASLNSTVGKLPNLQVLELGRCEFETTTWKSSEGEFCRLEYLVLTNVNLANWFASETHFPSLRHLAVDFCHALEEIPLEIGGINTLDLIELNKENSSSVLESARRILEEQRDVGNNLVVLIDGTPYEPGSDE